MYRYLFFAILAWVRGMFISPYKNMSKWSVSCGVYGPVSDRAKMMALGWKPYLFRKSEYGKSVSRYWSTKD